VPVRDIALTNGEQVSVYDTSGPYTDPAVQIDVRQGLPSVRGAWIEARGDSEYYVGRQRVALDDGGKRGEEDARVAQLRAEAAALQRQPRRAKSGQNVTQMHYAKRGIITPEMEYVALRENGRREWMAQYQQDAARELRLAGNSLGAAIPKIITPNSCATKWRAAAPSFRPISTTLKSSPWPSAAISRSRSTPTSATRP
jgi:phosphomethylpyrimidine synthase